MKKLGMRTHANGLIREDISRQSINVQMGGQKVYNEYK